MQEPGARAFERRGEGEVRVSSVYESKPWLDRYADYVPKELPLPTRSMADLFEESAERAPDRDAVRYFDGSISYGELNDLADRFATLLSDRGVEKGDRVAIYTQNNPQFLIVQYGAWKRGAIVVPLNPMLKKKELDYHLSDSGAKVLVCLESLYESVSREVVPGTAVEHVLTTSELDFLSEEVAGGKTVLEGVERQRFEDAENLLAILRETKSYPEAR